MKKYIYIKKREKEMETKCMIYFPGGAAVLLTVARPDAFNFDKN